MAANTAFPLSVFVGGPNGSDANVLNTVTTQFNSFVSTMGAPPEFMNGYIDQAQSIDRWPSNASWTAWSWTQMPGTKGIIPTIGLPMANSWDAGNPGGTFRAFASGQHDAALRGVVASWAEHGFTTQYWRPGYEANVPSMPWFVGSDKQTQSDFVSAFQHIAGVLRSAGQSMGVDVKIVWSPNIQNWNGDLNVMDLYPGNGSVDVIGPDQYDNMYPRDLYNWAKNDGSYNSSFEEWASIPANVEHYFNYPSANAWSPTGDGQGNGQSLQSYIDLARANGKSIALSETGAGGGRGTDTWENPTFVKWLATTLQNSGLPVSHVSMWNVNDNGDWDFTSDTAGKPLTAAAWRQFFGAGSNGNAGASNAAAPSRPAEVAAASAPAPVTSAPVTSAPVTSAPDAAASSTIVVNLSENAWQGDAQVTLSVDGRQIGGTQTITASRDAGQTQAVRLEGDFGGGSKTVSVNFLNDSYGGSADTDRNVYVESIVADGTTIYPNAGLYNGGSQSFLVPAASAGSDIFNLSAGFGAEVIAGFDPSSDILKIDPGGAASFAGLEANLSTSAGGAVITLGNGHTVTLPGVTSNMLTAANFAFG